MACVGSLPNALGHATPSKSLPGAWWGIFIKQAIKCLVKTKKCKVKKAISKYCLEYDSEEEKNNQLKSKYVFKCKILGNKKMKAIENNEIEKKGIFIAEKDFDSKDEEENEGLTCLEHAEMKAADGN